MPPAAKRTRRRMTCQLVHGSQRFSGLVLDVSSSGLFIQTTAKPRPRDRVTVELALPGQREPVRLETEVARLFVVPAQLLAVAKGGIGLRITNAPEDFFALISRLQPPDPDDPGAGAEDPGAAVEKRRYRVRMTRLGSARTRTLEVSAGCAEEAAELARAESGEGWKALETSEADAS